MSIFTEQEKQEVIDELMLYMRKQKDVAVELHWTKVHLNTVIKNPKKRSDISVHRIKDWLEKQRR